MKTNQEGIKLIQSYEKCVLKAYMPTKNDRPTIGWGNTFYQGPLAIKFARKDVKLGDIITKQEADSLFPIILESLEDFIQKSLKKTLTDNQFSAIVSFTYNVGEGNFKSSTLLKKVNINPLDSSIRDEFMKWNKQDKEVLNGLTLRREKEANLYFTT